MCVGTILPFSFSADLELIVDPLLLENGEIYFNAARLDRSLELNTPNYLAIAKTSIGINCRSPQKKIDAKGNQIWPLKMNIR